MQRWHELARGDAQRYLQSKRELASAFAAGVLAFLGVLVFAGDGALAALIGVGAVVAAAVLVPGAVFIGSALTANGRILRATVADLHGKVDGLAAAPAPSGSRAHFNPLQDAPRSVVALPILADLEQAERIIRAARDAGRYDGWERFNTEHWNATHLQITGWPNAMAVYTMVRTAVDHMNRLNKVMESRFLRAGEPVIEAQDDLAEAASAVGAAIAALQSQL